MAKAVMGTGGAYMVTRGAPRVQYMQGQWYVVGRGRSEAFEDAGDAGRRRDELLAAERARATAKAKPLKAAAAPAGAVHASGERVRYAVCPGGPRINDGAIVEVRRHPDGSPRVIVVRDRAGHTWLRAPADVEPVLP